MLVSQEPKYDVNGDGRIINRHTREPIPDDEPVFLLRAKDQLAVKALTAYFSAIQDPTHARAVADRLQDFKRFAQEHPERMKAPDTDVFPRPLR